MAPNGQCDVANHEGEWKYPAEKDGWVRAHDVIRADMADLLTAFKALEGRLRGGAVLQAWEQNCLVSYYGVFWDSVHKHHHHEEEVLFPELKKRFELPAKMSEDHEGLVNSLNECKGLVGALKPGECCADAAASLVEKFAAFEAAMKEHLLEEEQVGLPLFRKHFSPAEGQRLVSKIMSDMTMTDLGWFFHNMKPEERSDFAQQEGLSYPFAHWVLFPQAGKFNKRYASLLNAVTEGKEPPKPKKMMSFLFH